MDTNVILCISMHNQWQQNVVERSFVDPSRFVEQQL